LHFFPKKDHIKTIYKGIACFFSRTNYAFFYYFANSEFKKSFFNALEILVDNNSVHFDIKPENLLMSMNLIIKLTDFSLLKEVKNIKDSYLDVKIPGGTRGYIA
jgi:serine/threonine protein kinase